VLMYGGDVEENTGAVLFEAIDRASQSISTTDWYEGFTSGVRSGEV
jgi:flavin-binding protein dodecin